MTATAAVRSEANRPASDPGSRKSSGGSNTWRVLPRQAWVLLAATVAVAQVAHVLFRPAGWVYEWRWAAYQYQFSTVLLAPVAAGVAAVLGRRWVKAQPQLATTPRGGVGFLVGAASWAAVVTVIYLAAFLVVVVQAEALGAPSLRDLAVFIPALALLWAAIAVGYVAGWATRSWLAAPLAAIAVFGLLLAGWVAGLTPVVQVGGATASLVGLVVAPEVMVGQTIFYLAVAAAAFGVSHARLRRTAPTASVVSVALATVAFAALVSFDGDPLVASNEPLECSGTNPTVCVASPYAHMADDLRSVAEPMLARLDAAGVERPTELRHEFYLDVAGEAGVGVVTTDGLTGNEASVVFGIEVAYSHFSCSTSEDMIGRSHLAAEFSELILNPNTVAGSPEAARLAEVVAELDGLCVPPG